MKSNSGLNVRIIKSKMGEASSSAEFSTCAQVGKRLNPIGCSQTIALLGAKPFATASATDPLHAPGRSTGELGRPRHLHACRHSAPTRSTASYDEMGGPGHLHGPALLIRRSFPRPVQGPHKIRRSLPRPVRAPHNLS